MLKIKLNEEWHRIFPLSANAALFNVVYNFLHHHLYRHNHMTSIFPGLFSKLLNCWGCGRSFHFDSSACMHQFENLQNPKPNHTNESRLCVWNEFNCRIIHIQWSSFFLFCRFFHFILFYHSIELNVICMRFDKAYRHHLLFDSNSVIFEFDE